MKSIGVIILSRFSSSRLPGKALLKIKNKPVLQYIIERVSQVVNKSNIIIATSLEKSDDPIADFADLQGIQSYRGSLENVSERFIKAVEDAGWDYAIRINGDNIFVDIHLLKKMINLAQSGSYDFISNVDKRTYPKGMSIEVVKTSFYLNQFHKIIENEEYKEHVMQHLYLSENARIKYVYNTQLPEIAGIQLALDDADDFKRSQYIIDQFQYSHWTYNLIEIYKILNEKQNEKSI